MPFRRTKSKKRRIKSKRQNTNRKQKKKQTIAYRKKQLLTGGINVENESAGNVENESAKKLQECLKLEEEQDRKNTETKKACEENNNNKIFFKVNCDDEYKEKQTNTEAETQICINRRMAKNSKLSQALRVDKK